MKPRFFISATRRRMQTKPYTGITTKSRRQNRFGGTYGSAMGGLGLIVFSCGASGQAVSLGEAGNFAIVSSQGVTNSGPSIVNGDIALSPLTTITGFTFSTPAGLGVVNGTVHYNDTSAQTAQNDALTAYNTLAGMAYLPANDLTGQDLGGMTLAPGVYHFDSSAELTGVLTLATGTDPNAAYVFQIGSTLTTATTSSVVVTGAGAGTTPNIFWQVGSSATLATGTDFTGSILALASVSMGTGTSLENGRALALNGAVTLLTNSITAPVMVLAAPGRYWNGTNSNRWSEVNWSSTADGLDNMTLGSDVDVVFSVNPGPINQDTILDADVTISSLTVNDAIPVTIGNPVGITHTLTISATGLATGININDGAGLTTINSNLELGYLSQIVTVNNADGLIINGVISGDNGLTKAGTGVLTLTGAETYTGSTIVANGTLQLGDGIITGTSIALSDAVFIAPDGTLAIHLADGETFGNSVNNDGRIQWIADGTNIQAPASVFSGTGDMLITAPGTTVLLGDNTFSGGTTVDTSGVVLVGNLLSDSSSPFGTGVLTIDDGAIDTFGSQLLQIGTGGYVQTGGEIAMHLDGTDPGDYTRYDVTGTANLSGGTVFVYGDSGNYVPQGGDVQNIIGTTGGLTGGFSSNTPESRFFNTAAGVNYFYFQGDTLLYPTVTYDPDNAYITWVRDSFRSLDDLTSNQDAVGGGLDGFVDANPGIPSDLIDFLNGQDLGDLPGMYDLIAPDELTAIYQIAFSASEIQNANVRRHLDRVRQGSSFERQHTTTSTDSKGGMTQQTVMTQESNLWSIFVEGTGGSASVDGDGNASGYDFDTWGATLGASKRVSDNFAFGVLGSYGDSDASLVNGGNIDAESYKFAVYATWFNDGFFVDGLLGAGYNSYDTRRSALLGFAEGSTNAWEFNAMINTGYDFSSGNWTFTPTASLAYTRVNLDGFNESGSLAPLSYPDQHQESLRSELGARIAYTAMFNGVAITPQVRVAWQHEFMDHTQSMTSNFIGGSGPSFSVNGPHMKKDRAILSAGLTAQITPALAIYGFYDGHIGNSNYNSNQVSVGMKIDF